MPIRKKYIIFYQTILAIGILSTLVSFLILSGTFLWKLIWNGLSRVFEMSFPNWEFICLGGSACFFFVGIFLLSLNLEKA